MLHYGKGGVRLCGLQSDVVGAGGCPRERGHKGECYWFIPWEFAGPGDWRVIVYSGPAAERVKRCRGRFTSMPTLADVHQLLLTLSTYRHREQQKREWRRANPVRIEPTHTLDFEPDGQHAVVRRMKPPNIHTPDDSAASRAARALARSAERA